MPIYRLSELRLFLQELGIQPKKGLSQNFLIDGNILRNILRAAAVTSEDIILEIGPGPGALTEILLESGPKVIAVEKDTVLARELPRLDGGRGFLTVFNQDIMDFPVEQELAKALSSGRKAKVVANLPYHLTLPILTRLLPLNALISDVVVMVQEEAADRFVALPGSSEYGYFNLLLQFYSNPRVAFSVGKNCFYPVPKVDSAIAHLQLNPPPKGIDPELFFSMVRRAFDHRRKMLKASLPPLYPSEIVMDSLKSIGKDPLSRPEALSFDEFIKLFLCLSL